MKKLDVEKDSIIKYCDIFGSDIRSMINYLQLNSNIKIFDYRDHFNYIISNKKYNEINNILTKNGICIEDYIRQLIKYIIEKKIIEINYSSLKCLEYIYNNKNTCEYIKLDCIIDYITINN